MPTNLNTGLGLLKFIYRNINWKLGVLGGLFSAGIAFYVNLNAGTQAATIPALKQFVYSILVGGSLAKLTQRISLHFENKWIAIMWATLIPTAITVLLIASIHLFKGTPNPLETIFFTSLPTPIGFLIVGSLTRFRSDKKKHATEQLA